MYFHVNCFLKNGYLVLKKNCFSSHIFVILVLEIGQAYHALYDATNDISFILIFLKIKGNE